jgi:hypothetical protein
VSVRATRGRLGWLAGAVLLLAAALVALWNWRPSGPPSPPQVPSPVTQLPQQPAMRTPSPPAVSAIASAPGSQAVTPDGTRVRLIRRKPLERPDAPFGPKYPGLLAAAQAGDHEAQYVLGLMLYECRDVPADDLDLQREIENIHQTRMRGGWTIDDPGTESRMLRQRGADCDGIPAEARAGYRDWMVQAADAGLLEAQLGLMYHLPQAEYCQYLSECSPQQRAFQEHLQQEALHYVSQARDAGSADALWTFGAWYMGDEVLPPDPVEAYASFYALEQIYTASGQGGRFATILDDLGDKLRPVELGQAQARAAELLANPSCCVLTR